MSGNNNQEPGTCLTEIHYSFVSFHSVIFCCFISFSSYLVKVNKAVPLCSEAEENCTLGALASHNAFASWHFASALLRCMQGPVVCAVSADRIWRDKALGPSFIFPHHNSLWRSPLPLVAHLALHAQAWGHLDFEVQQWEMGNLWHLGLAVSSVKQLTDNLQNSLNHKI